MDRTCGRRSHHPGRPHAAKAATGRNRGECNNDCTAGRAVRGESTPPGYTVWIARPTPAAPGTTCASALGFQTRRRRALPQWISAALLPLIRELFRPIPLPRERTNVAQVWSAKRRGTGRYCTQDSAPSPIAACDSGPLHLWQAPGGQPGTCSRRCGIESVRGHSALEQRCSLARLSRGRQATDSGRLRRASDVAASRLASPRTRQGPGWLARRLSPRR
jgi:hypothetical protein